MYISRQMKAGNLVYNPQDYKTHEERIAQTRETKGRLVAQLYVIMVQPTTWDVRRAVQSSNIVGGK
jgi:hypothetical protein